MTGAIAPNEMPSDGPDPSVRAHGMIAPERSFQRIATRYVTAVNGVATAQV
jgi:hypothetical protein